MKCHDCKYCLELDVGYSNYTVEGTDVDCLLNLNPDFPKDSWYGEEAALDYAEKCEKFTPGSPVQVDVEQEAGDLEEYSDDQEIKDLLRKREDGSV